MIDFEWYVERARRLVRRIVGKAGNGPEGRTFYDSQGIVISGKVGRDAAPMFVQGLLNTIQEVERHRLINPMVFDRAGIIDDNTSIQVKKGRVSLINQNVGKPPSTSAEN